MTFRDFATYFMLVPSANQWRVLQQNVHHVPWLSVANCWMFHVWQTPCCCHSEAQVFFSHMLFAPRGDRPLVGRSLHEVRQPLLGYPPATKSVREIGNWPDQLRSAWPSKLQNFDPNFMEIHGSNLDKLGAFFCWATHQPLPDFYVSTPWSRAR